jgi:PadR family transcriptional regulator, regulatory protein PadR
VDTSVRRYVAQLLRGMVGPLMLCVISEFPGHGYHIAREIERRSCGYFRLTTSTVYSALRRLEDDGLVRSTWNTVSSGSWRRCYYLTEQGREMLREMLDEWERFSFAAEQVLARD